MKRAVARKGVARRAPECEPEAGNCLDGYLEDFRDEMSRISMPKFGVVPAAAYCFDVLADAGGRLLSFCGEMAVAFRGYSYYDNGHPFAR